MGTPNSILLAASRWLTELRRRTEESARRTLRAEPLGRDLTPTQYELALEWLKRHELYVDGSLNERTLGRHPGAVVLSAEIEAEEPAWLAAADTLVQDPAEIPLNVAELGASLGLRDYEIFEEISQVWRKFDDSARRELGAAGERALVAWLKQEVRAEVVHVSLFDDTLGYDVALVQMGQVCAKVEVKASRRSDAVVIFLSRNEFEALGRSPNWCLQVVHLDTSNRITGLSWIPSADLSSGAPSDGELANWQSMKLVLPISDLRSGAAPQITGLLKS